MSDFWYHFSFALLLLNVITAYGWFVSNQARKSDANGQVGRDPKTGRFTKV